MKRKEGNGHAEFVINIDRVGPGQVLFSPEDYLDRGVHYPIHLYHALSDWLGKNPGVSVRQVLPVVDEGQTILLHVWFDGLEEQVAQANVAKFPPAP